MYEDVTVYVHPDPDRYLTHGWVYPFADGKAGYRQEWTALKSSNWHSTTRSGRPRARNVGA